MQKARDTTGIVILILLSALMHLPQGQAIVPDSQTISIIETHDDAFITEAGVLIDAWLCHILDPTMDIRSFLVFRDVKVNNWEPLENATLRFRTTVAQDFDADSSVTIYGMKYSELQEISIVRPDFVLSVPLTSASVTVNTSQFYGQQWHEVNVTNIVEELIRSINWDGDGHAGTETGDAIGFVIYGAEGHDTRWFIDYHYGTPSLASQLVIHWNHEPPPPSGYEDAIFNQTYGNYTIWEMPGAEGALGYSLDPMEYLFSNRTVSPYKLKYDDVIGTGPVLVSDSEFAGPSAYNTQRKLVRLNNGTLYSVFIKKLAADYQIYVKNSPDDGQTWTGETRISTFPGMVDESQYYPAMAVDSRDYLHVVWQGKGDGVTQGNIWYALNNTSWQTPVRISTLAGMDARPNAWVSVAVDSSNNVHVVWEGWDGSNFNVYYNFYNTSTSSWQTPILISTYDGMDTNGQQMASIAVDGNDQIQVTWKGIADGYTHNQVWYAERTTSWQTPIRISTYPDMHLYLQTDASICVDSNDYVYVTWYGKAQGFTTKHSIWVNNRTVDWGTPIRISNYTNMGSYDQTSPSIAVNSTDALYVLWHGRATPYVDEEKVWGTTCVDDWANPVCLQTLGSNIDPTLRWAKWPVGGPPTDSTWYVHETDVCTVTGPFEDYNKTTDWIDIEKPDPEDPDPGGQWSEGPGGAKGPFTRFRMRFYFLILGLGCVFGPIMFFAWRRPSGYYIFCGAIIIIIGVGLLLSIGQV